MSSTDAKFDESQVNWSYNEQRMLKYMLEQDGMQFMRYFFSFREGSKMVLNWHHYVIEYVLQAVYDGKIKRLIVNIAPGYTKTEQVVINFICRGLALNPRSKYIYSSFSQDLVLEHSSKIKDTVESDEYQSLWPMATKNDAKAKGKWFTEAGGGMIAVPSGGKVTGFRAGRMDKTIFTGALIIDDPIKPLDAYSNTKRNVVNNLFTNTLRSRMATEEVPIIVIMQRLHEDDLSGHLLCGGSGDEWHHLTIPTLLNDETINSEYPKEYTHGKHIDLDGVLAAMHSGVPYEF